MKRSVVLFLTGLTLLSSVADAGRRSGGGFGGSRSSGSSYSRSSGSSYRSNPSRSNYGGSSYGSSSYGGSYGGSSSSGSSTSGSYSNNYGSSRYSRPSTTSSGSSWNSPSRSSSPYPGSPYSGNTSSSSRTSGSSSSSSRSNPTPKTSYPSNAAIRNSPLNTAAAARVTPAQLNQWNKLQLPAGVGRSALTYSATPSAGYQYQLQPGRYYPYPQSYYRQHNIGYGLLKYALIFSAVSSIADAVTPNVVIANPSYGNGNYPSYAPSSVVVQQRGPSFWSYAWIGLLAAAAAWLLMGRRRR